MPHIWPSSCLTHDCSEVTVILIAHHLMTKPYRKGVSSQILIIWNIVYDGNNMRGWPKIKQKSYNLKSRSINRKMCRLLVHRGWFATVILTQVPFELKKKMEIMNWGPHLDTLLKLREKIPHSYKKTADRKHLRSIYGNGQSPNSIIPPPWVLTHTEL